MWLDDVRPPPGGWVWVHTCWEAMQLLKRGEVGEASLDHDLGQVKTGYHLVCWMAEHGKWPDTKPLVHSMNPVGAEGMRYVINRYFGRKAGEEA